MSTRVKDLLPQYYDRLSPSGLSIVDGAASLARSYQHQELESIHLAIAVLRHPFSYRLLIPANIDSLFSADILNKQLEYSRPKIMTLHASQSFLQTIRRANKLALDSLPIDSYTLLGGSLLEGGLTGLGIFNDSASETRARMVSSMKVNSHKAGFTPEQLSQIEQTNNYPVIDPQIIILRAAGLSAGEIADKMGFDEAECQLRILKLVKAGMVKDRTEPHIGRFSQNDILAKINDLNAAGYTNKEKALILNIGILQVSLAIRDLAERGVLKLGPKTTFKRKQMLDDIAEQNKKIK